MNASSTRSGTQPEVAGGLFVYTQSQRLGHTLQVWGKQEMAMSLVSMPKTKIWTQRTRMEHAEIVSRQRSARISTEKVNPKKFDYRPGNTKQSKQIDAHWSRRPLKGNKSRSSPGRIKLHRGKRLTRGAGVFATGKVLPLLGAGFYAYDVYHSDNPILKVAKDVGWAISNPLTFGYESSGLGSAQRFAFRNASDDHQMAPLPGQESYISRQIGHGLRWLDVNTS